MSPASLQIVRERRRDGGDEACGDNGPEPLDVIEMVVEMNQDHSFTCDTVNLHDPLGVGGGVGQKISVGYSGGRALGSGSISTDTSLGFGGLLKELIKIV